MKVTGNNAIDSLTIGYKWENKKITYSFFDGGYYPDPEAKGVREFSEPIKAYVRDILENLIEPLINVDFVEVSDKGNNSGQIRYQFSENAGYAYAYLPYGEDELSGDVHLASQFQKDFEQGPGSYDYETIIHEILHALGLKHPGNYNGEQIGSEEGPFLPGNEDNTSNTVMSYNFTKVTDKPYYTGGITPMAYDIAALQSLYGAKEKNQGNTNYKFSSVYGYNVGNQFFGNRNQEILQSIWDSGGKDTFDFSNLALDNSGYRLDMNEAGFVTTKKAYNGYSYEDIVSKKSYNATDFGTSIAYNFTVENLVNSSSSDDIILNKAANIISGYQSDKKTGQDVIFKSDGKDILLLSGYKSSEVTQNKNDEDLIVNLGSNGSIRVKDYYAVGKKDRLQIKLYDKAIIGTDSADKLTGTNRGDLIIGYKGNDNLTGYKGNDEIQGGDGNDIIEGGKGYDILVGGSGADIFVYNNINDGIDTIVDFEIGHDRIKLDDFFQGSIDDDGDDFEFEDYIKFVRTGSGTQVQVNPFGDDDDDGGEQFNTIAILNNINPNQLSTKQFIF